jgi:hypothetical protein
MFLHLIVDPEGNASALVYDLIANDISDNAKYHHALSRGANEPKKTHPHGALPYGVAGMPGKSKAGDKNHDIGGGLDFMATFASLAGAKLPEKDRAGRKPAIPSTSQSDRRSTQVAQRLGWVFAEEQAIIPGEAAELPDTEAGSHLGDSRHRRISGFERSPNLMECSEL